MPEDKSIRLAKAAKELNVSVQTIIDHLAEKGHSIENKPTTKLSEELHAILLRDFQGEIQHKEEAKSLSMTKLRKEDKSDVILDDATPKSKSKKEVEQDEILIKNITEVIPEKEKPKAAPPVKTEEPKEPERVKINRIELEGAKVVGKVDLGATAKKTKKTVKSDEKEDSKPKETLVAKAEEAPAEILPPPTPLSIAEEKVKETEKIPVPETPTPVAETPTETPEVSPAAEIETPTSEEPKTDRHETKYETLTGPKILGNITLPVNEPRKKSHPVASSNLERSEQNKKRRKRKEKGPTTGTAPSAPGTANPRPSNDERRRPVERRVDTRAPKEEVSDKEIQDQIKATLARLSGAGKSGKFAQRAKFRRQKRDDIASAAEEAMMEKELQSKVLKVTEFVTANQLAQLMDVPVNQVISTFMNLGMFVSINQRLDAETLTLVAEEFGYTVEFVTIDDQETIEEEQDKPEDLLPRAPIITVMGHVDHGKTSLLDYIRKANVIAGEAGGITQHIGAYEVQLENGRKITFLDTPGHEAFTAMRARGAKVTDIVIIVIAADDSVMPQTVEAINHAQAAGVPIVFAFNKMDKPGANSNKIREELSQMNILVEDWGGKYQCQEISAKQGLNVDVLLEKVLLEADLLEVKANPNKLAQGTVIEAALDKGRGIITTVLVQSGTLKVGDPILAGCYSGRVKALYNERGHRITLAGPATPVQVLGMQGAPQAGDKFNAMESEVEAREIATKRLQLQREQGMRTQKHITLDEIGRRLAIGNFKELNVIVKGDVDGSVEALADSLLKLSTSEIQVNVVHKAVGQISESDVLLASASDAIIIGFQVRPSLSARKLAEQEEIDIRLYSIIYDAINEIKSAMEGMLSPEIEEKIVCNVEIRDVFKITKVGTIAGCMVMDGKITRNTKVRVIRDGVVVYTGELASLKRFKDDVKEVSAGFECGLNIHNFNDIKEGDIIEGYEQVEIKRKLTV